MAFSRAATPEPKPSAAELTARMVGIGMNFASTPRKNADIESTLVYASAVGMDDSDFRVLAVLTTWLGIHSAHVNADRLVRLVNQHPSARVQAFWAAIATWLKQAVPILCARRNLEKGCP